MSQKFVIQCQIGEAVWFLYGKRIWSADVTDATKYRSHKAAQTQLDSMAKAGGAVFSVVGL